METFEIFIIKQTGGTRGNSSRGTNFGEVGNPQNETITLPSGISVETEVKFRHGGLLSYAVRQAYIPNATLADIFHLFFNQDYEIFTNVDVSDPNWVRNSNGEQIIPSKYGRLIDEKRFRYDTFTGEWNMEFFSYMQKMFNVNPHEVMFVGLNDEPYFDYMVYGEQGHNFRKAYLEAKGYMDINVHTTYPEKMSHLTPEEIWGV